MMRGCCLVPAAHTQTGPTAPLRKQWFSRAVAADRELNAARFGHGVFFEDLKDWNSAAGAYLDQLKYRPLDSELHYRHGFACDRGYKWSDADSSYQAAVALKPDEAYWHYRLGFVQERQQNLQEAADSYGAAIQSK